MTLRVVAISLIAAICLGSPATASTTTDDKQQVRGRGARDRSADSGGGNRGQSDGDQPSATRGDRDGDNPRTAVPRTEHRTRASGRRDHRPGNNRPIVSTRNRPNVNINIGSRYRGQRYYTPFQYDRWARQYYRWSPIGYAPWGLISSSIGMAHFSAYGAYGLPFAHHPPYTLGNGYDIGGIRLKIRPRDAQVFVDGYYAGLVDDFDGTFQSLRLEQGGHTIEIRMPGFEDLVLDVHVQPGRTIALSETLQPRP